MLIPALLDPNLPSQPLYIERKTAEFGCEEYYGIHVRGHMALELMKAHIAGTHTNPLTLDLKLVAQRSIEAADVLIEQLNESAK